MTCFPRKDGVVEGGEQLLLVVIIDNGADKPERLDALVNAEIVENVEACGMNGGCARLLMQDVAHVEQGNLDPGAPKDQADDKAHRPATGDDDAVLLGHAP